MWRRPRWNIWHHLLLIAILLAATAVTFAPSLRHVPRADQWAFLIDAMDAKGFWELASQTWSYNRTRLICPGDTDLYRPILFLLLAAEKEAFGSDFARV